METPRCKSVGAPKVRSGEVPATLRVASRAELLGCSLVWVIKKKYIHIYIILYSIYIYICILYIIQHMLHAMYHTSYITYNISLYYRLYIIYYILYIGYSMLHMILYLDPNNT